MILPCLSLWQPWASFLVWGVKGPETRGWSTKYRGPMLIHAAKRRTQYNEGLYDGVNVFHEGLKAAGKEWRDLPYGALIGIGELTTIYHTEDTATAEPHEMEEAQSVLIPMGKFALTPLHQYLGDYSAGRFAWVFENLKPLDEPIPYRGAQGIFKVEISDELARSIGLEVAVAQDYMCEPVILAKTGLTGKEHQRLTIERYVQLKALCPNVYIMPVLQGYTVAEYLDHIDQYGDLLEFGAYVGVGSVCKRNTNVAQIEHILSAIKAKRPDLKLHGFGLKITALASGLVRELLYSADSMAWSFAARKQGRDANDWNEAARFDRRIATQAVQLSLPMGRAA